MADRTEEHACGKLNLSLDVLGKLEGGYHAMRMVMESVCFGDDVGLTLRRDGELRLETELPWLPKDSRNLAVEAARVFREALGEPMLGADIRLTKRIPVGAGMGGGSADAAAVLRGMNRLTGRPFTAEKLRELGLSIGSDVPYCVEGGSRLAEGRGELLTPIAPPPECSVVIAKPSFSISTGTLFGYIDARTSRTHPDTAGLVKAMERNDLPGTARRMYNVFEDVLPRSCRECAAVRSALLDCGALGAVMTGTGSAVFGLFEDRKTAENARNRMRELCRTAVVTSFAEESEI